MEKKDLQKNILDSVAPAQTTTKKQKPQQFKDGFDPRRAGNGRKKGERLLSTILKESLIRIDKDRKKNPAAQRIIDKMISMAVEGDKDVIEMMFAYIDGKPETVSETSPPVKISESSFFDEKGNLRIRERTAQQIDEPADG